MTDVQFTEPKCPKCGSDKLIEGDNGLECQECGWCEEYSEDGDMES